MRTFNILYEIGEYSDGGELAEVFLKRFHNDTEGLDYTLESTDHDLDSGSVSATIKTRARITSEWFANADVAVEA